MPRVVRLLVVALLLEVAGFLVTTVPGVRQSQGFDPLVDGWLQGFGYVTAASLALSRAAVRTSDRIAWGWIALALVGRALGFVLWLAVVRTQEPVPSPSVADVAWLAMYPLLMVGLVRMVRDRARLMTTSLALDGAVGALAAAAVAITLLYPALASLAVVWALQ